MKLTVATLAVGLLAAVPLASCSQQAAAQDSQQSPARAEMQKARDDAKTAAFNDLSADHRARVQAIIDQINNGSSSDLRGAVSQIDAMLTPAESKAVLGERDKMIAAIRANAPAGAFNGNGSRGFGNGQARNDAGRFLVQVSVSRDRMRELRQQQQQSQPQQ